VHHPTDIMALAHEIHAKHFKKSFENVGGGLKFNWDKIGRNYAKAAEVVGGVTVAAGTATSLIGLPEVGVPLLAAGGFALATGKVASDAVGGSLTMRDHRANSHHMGGGILADAGDGVKTVGKLVDQYGMQATHITGDALRATAPIWGDAAAGVRGAGDFLKKTDQKYFKAAGVMSEGLSKGLHGLDSLF